MQDPLIIERPKSTFQLERLMLQNPDFSFSYDERAQVGYDYDKRFVGRYAYKYAWIGGWWASQLGRGCYAYAEPFPLRSDWVFHHPWLLVDDFTEASYLSQRKPVMVQQQNGCWWAVEFSNSPIPTMSIPKLSINPPKSPVSRFDTYNIVVEEASPHVTQLLQLSINTWAAISNRRTSSSIARYAQSALNWISKNPVDPDTNQPWPSAWSALLGWKLRLAAREVFLT
jgi:hypothetical protein